MPLQRFLPMRVCRSNSAAAEGGPLLSCVGGEKWWGNPEAFFLETRSLNLMDLS